MISSKRKRSTTSGSALANSVVAVPKTSMWTASRSGTGSTELIKLFQNAEQLTFKEFFGLLQDDQNFARWYTELLKSSSLTSYFWEYPPLTTSSFGCGMEFVLIDAPALGRMRPDTEAFRSHFFGEEVAIFQNLGGDATLIAPSPADSSPGYAHLAAFLYEAPASQVRAIWQSVGRTISKSLSDKPIWLSTSGLGVAWLHIRLDSSPKYYQHQPYKIHTDG